MDSRHATQSVRQLSRILYKSALFMQNKAKVKIGKMNISLATTKHYDKNNEQSAMNVIQNKAKQSQFQTGHLQRPSQCYRPAGGNNDKHNQNYVSYFDLGEKTLQKPEIDTKNSYKESQKCSRNQPTAQ